MWNIIVHWQLHTARIDENKSDLLRRRSMSEFSDPYEISAISTVTPKADRVN